MRIHDIELFSVAIQNPELDKPTRSLLIRVASDEGIEGWGETWINWRPEELPSRRASLLAMLDDWEIFNIHELHDLDFFAAAPLRCGVEMAMWDVIGKKLGQPLYNLFGGGYRRRVPISIRLPHAAPHRVAKLAREHYAQGFHSQVITSVNSAEEDIQAIRAVREELGFRLEMRLDGRGSYDHAAARELCAELEEQDLQFFLDPIKTKELYPYASLARQTSVPLAVGGNLNGAGDVLAAIRCGAGKHVMINIEQVGGITPARQCAEVASAARVGAFLGGRTYLGPAIAAGLQLAASTPAFSLANECGSAQLVETALCEPLEIIDGMVTVPQGPGLGVEIDRAKVEKYMLV